MRTLSEIISLIKSGGKPEYEELKYSVLTLAALNVFNKQALIKLSEAETEYKKPIFSYSAQFQLDESIRRDKAAYNKDPKEYIGWNNDPENPDYIQRVKQSEKLLEKIMNKIEKEKDLNND